MSSVDLKVFASNRIEPAEVIDVNSQRVDSYLISAHFNWFRNPFGQSGRRFSLRLW
jgi:hypothetical protein